ncbi:MAG: hypothetical protein ACR2G3_11610 [Solirubrobacterales bacterium]
MRRGLSGAFGAIVVVLLALPMSASAERVANPCSQYNAPGLGGILELQPVDNGVVKVARIAGSTAAEPDEWQMHLDIWPCLSFYSSNYKVLSIRLDHLDAQGQIIRTRFPVVQGDTVANPLNYEAGYLRVREPAQEDGDAEQGQFPYPLPAKVRIFLVLGEIGGSDVITIDEAFPVAEFRAPRGGYFAPFRDSDLPEGQYWGQGYHPTNNQQRWALDLGVDRWTGSEWTDKRAGATAPYSPQDYLVYGEPLYAMADGEAIQCNNATPNDTPGKFGGGNHIWVRTGNELWVYAHLQEDSIPEGLCPQDSEALHRLANPTKDLPSDKQYEVEAGQFLGEVGTTGASSHPHTHIHAQRGLPAAWGSDYTEGKRPADGRPIPFFNARVYPNTQAWDDANANPLDPAAVLPYHTHIQGDPCRQLENPPDDEEEVRLEVPSRCFPDVYNTMSYKGMRLVHIDVTETADARSWTTVWRRAEEAPGTEFYYGITEEQARTLIFGSPKRVLELESYRVGSAVRFALILVNDPFGPEQFTEVAQTAAEWGVTYSDLTSGGSFPAMISVTEANDIAYITTVYERAKVGTYSVHAGLTQANFQQAFDDNAAAGRSLAWVESHVEDGAVRFAATWYEKLTGPYAASGVRNLAGIESDIVTHVGNGGYTRALTGWQIAGNFSYRGLWWAPPSVVLRKPKLHGKKVTLRFKRSDPFSRTECHLDDNDWKPCVTGKTYGGLSEGNHRVYVRAVSREQIPGDASKRKFEVR